MSRSWHAFDVYNRNKHSKNPGMFGGNHTNVSGSKTGYIYANEHREKPRNTSVSSQSPVSSADSAAEKEEPLRVVDVSKLTKKEFKEIYEGLREGQPDNKVNF